MKGERVSGSCFSPEAKMDTEKEALFDFRLIGRSHKSNNHTSNHNTGKNTNENENDFGRCSAFFQSVVDLEIYLGLRVAARRAECRLRFKGHVLTVGHSRPQIRFCGLWCNGLKV